MLIKQHRFHPRGADIDPKIKIHTCSGSGLVAAAHQLALEQELQPLQLTAGLLNIFPQQVRPWPRSRKP